MTMKLTLGRLRSVIREAIGDRSHPDDKPHMICWVLSQAGRPMSRPEVMRQVEKLEGKDPEAFRPTTNQDYWRPATVNRPERWDPDPDPANPGHYIPFNPRDVPNDTAGAKSSVLVRGFVKVAGKKGNQLLFTLTPAGEQLAAEADAWIKARPDLFGDQHGVD